MISPFYRVLVAGRFLFIALLVIPTLAGVVGVVLPALGMLPALGYYAFSTAPFSALLATQGLGKMVWLSVSSGLVSTLIAFVLSLLILARFYQSRWLNRIQHLLSPMLVIPHTAAAIALAFLLTPSGWPVRLFSAVFEGWGLPPALYLTHDTWGVAMTLALAFKELPFLLLMALSALAQPQFGTRLEGQYRVALSLGYRPAIAFFKVVFPQLYPMIRLPVLAVLAFASANVEIPLILGPNNPPTLALAVVYWFNDVDLTLRLQASAAALLQLLVTLGLLGFWWAMESLIRRSGRQWLSDGRRCYPLIWMEQSVALLISVLLLLVAIAVVTLVLWSVAGYWPYPQLLPQSLTTIHWQTATEALVVPLKNSLVIGLAASCSAVLLSVLVLEGQQQGLRMTRVMQVALYLPLLVPGVALLFGLVWFQQLLFPQWVWLNIFIGHFIYVLPYVFFALATSYQRLDSRLTRVAASLGASPFTIMLRVKFGQLFAGFLVALALGLAISLSQYLPTLLGGGGQVATLTTEAFATFSGASRRLGAVYAVMQLAIPLLGFVLAWSLPRLLIHPARQVRSVHNPLTDSGV